MSKPNAKKTQNAVPFHLNQMSENGLFCGYASVFHMIDSYGDCIFPGAFQSTLKNWSQQNRAPKMLWQHSTLDPIGVWDVIEEDRKGLYVEGQLLLEVQKAREAYTLIKHRAIDGLSIGYRVIEAQEDQHKSIRNIHALELFEVSLVTFAANLQARVIQVKQKFVEEKEAST